MLGKVAKGQYRTWGEYGADMELVFRKCVALREVMAQLHESRVDAPAYPF